MGNMADGLAEGMALSAARRAQSAASASGREAEIQTRKAREAEGSASRSKDAAFILAARVKALEDELHKTDARLGVVALILRGVNDMVEQLPFELRQQVRDSIIQKSRRQLDEGSQKHLGLDWLPIAKDMQTPKLLGVV
jgi:hypothetical protein